MKNMKNREIAVPVVHPHAKTGEPITDYYYASREQAAKGIVRLLKAPAKHAKRFGLANLMLMIGDEFENRTCCYAPNTWVGGSNAIAKMWREAGFKVEQRVATEGEVKAYCAKEASISLNDYYFA
jgi:hypothetical protein